MIGTFIPWHDSSRNKDRRFPWIGYVIQENGCHLWTGALVNGYGYVRVGGRLQRPAHLVRYEREVGPVPEGLVLDHFACDNKACCNPAHVRPVTARENTLRGNAASSVSASRTHCPNGHALVGDNLVPGRLRRGERCCRECKNANDRRSYARRRGRAA